MNKTDFLSACWTDLCETPHLHYTDGYKYQSRNNMIYKTPIKPYRDIVTDLVALRTDGHLWVGKYFAWDGCSGPTWDDHTNMRAGQAHDALYFLHRQGLLPIEYRPYSDAILRQLMVNDGALQFRARYYEWAVNRFASSCADPANKKPVLIAP